MLSDEATGELGSASKDRLVVEIRTTDVVEDEKLGDVVMLVSDAVEMTDDAELETAEID